MEGIPALLDEMHEEDHQDLLGGADNEKHSCSGGVMTESTGSVGETIGSCRSTGRARSGGDAAGSGANTRRARSGRGAGRERSGGATEKRRRASDETGGPLQKQARLEDASSSVADHVSGERSYICNSFGMQKEKSQKTLARGSGVSEWVTTNWVK
ncbi:hypothetical protein GN244_ATG14459 [Phytophthora infestans]|uniref:Uncharacterized protein n=1 Tax=Phytophthora infestans TaxID=4787 RepID=A0A833SHK8_PHYIN|nr:hypothetical protein GN244_ATG14459 [Phytophthora infestans]